MAILVLLPFYWIQSGLNPPLWKICNASESGICIQSSVYMTGLPMVDSINWRNSMLEDPFVELFQESTSSFELARSLAMHNNLKRNYIPIEWIWKAAERSIEAFEREMNLKMDCIKNEEETHHQ